MSFTKAIKSIFSNYANFNGRACRAEFWWFVLFRILSVLFIFIGMGFLARVARFEAKTNWLILLVTLGLFELLVFVPTMAVIVRRLHDSGRSGKRFFFTFIPLLIWVIPLSIFAYNAYSAKGGMGIGFMVGFFLTIAIVIPVLIFTILLLIWMLAPSDQGTNQWGPQPEN